MRVLFLVFLLFGQFCFGNPPAPQLTLEEALTTDNILAAEALIDAGAYLRRCYQLGTEYTTPLIYSLLHNKIEMSEMLLRKGADPDFATHNSNITPLMISLRQNSIRFLKLLLEHGAKEIYDPLLNAAIIGLTDAVRLFLSHKSALAQDPIILMAAIKNHHIDIAKVFIIEFGAKMKRGTTHQ